MTNRTIFTVIGSAFGLFFAFFLISLYLTYPRVERFKRVSPYEVKGIEVQKGTTRFSLNFKQQITLLKMLNQAEDSSQNNFPKLFESKIYIHRFNTSPLLFDYQTNENGIFFGKEGSKLSVLCSCPEFKQLFETCCNK